jgi:sulfur-oxidizing protein SoxY
MRHARQLRVAGGAALTLILGCVAAVAQTPDPWPGLARDIFQGRTIQAGGDAISLQSPAQANDAAIVPMTINLEKPAAAVRSVTLVIDQNPAPMAARFTIGANSGLTTISTRVRVNDYTKVHAVAETSDGALQSIERFVKAAGGCSAPSVKDPTEASANLGRMKFREILASDLADARRREAQIMIRHPNASGMQMDQGTGKYIPARYIDSLTVMQGDDLVFRMEGGISISEDPNFRFTYTPNGAKALTVEAHDSDGLTFRAQYPIGDAS